MSCWNSSRRRMEMAVTSSGTAEVTLPTDDQILITREFDAPRELVYKAWTTPELVLRWWHANRGQMKVAGSRRLASLGGFGELLLQEAPLGLGMNEPERALVGGASLIF